MEAIEKTPQCQVCSSTGVVVIVYGLPGLELRDKALAGEVVLGGCCISPDSPRWACKDCGQRFGFFSRDGSEGRGD